MSNDSPDNPLNKYKPLTPGYENAEGPHHEHDSEGNLIIDFTGDDESSAEFQKASSQEALGQRTIDPATGYPSELIWTTRDHRRIPIPHMQDSHLLNTIAFLRRNVEPIYKRRMIAQLVKGLVKTAFIKQMFDFAPWEEDNADYKLNLLKGHLKEIGQRIYNKTDDEFLREYHPQYQHLYQEAYKRKLLIGVDPTKLGDKG